ncbi:MAG: heme-binding domain-containing protein, partial [Planctomycetaceae bacterium]|nr:heme-binding domain-containing protein [Planctomycetaceae bacterium]
MNPDFSEEFVAQTVEDTLRAGILERGAAVFTSPKFACISCHKVGGNGGIVGPDLSKIGRERKLSQLVESVFWPKREVKPEFEAWQVVTSEGKVHRGYRVSSNAQQVTLLDPTKDETLTISRDEIEDEVKAGTLMPDGLTAAMTRQQQLDVLRFLTALGTEIDPVQPAWNTALAHQHSHAPATFDWTREPIHPEEWPAHTHPVNQYRVYDFFTKQAAHFKQQMQDNPLAMPPLLAAHPGLDGGEFGHWGTQKEQDWADDRWNETDLGNLQCGIFRGAGVAVTRGICLRIGENRELSVCFNPDTLTYDAVWKNGFVKFSAVRHGFINGLLMDGEMISKRVGSPPNGPIKYHGYYRHGDRVVFAYRIGETEYLDSPWVEEGQFVRIVAPRDEHPLRHLIAGGERQWPQELITNIVPGKGNPFAIDTIELPTDNPWKAQIFCGGHDFLSDGSALVCTMQGDVWKVTGLDGPVDQPGKATWTRFASGLHHALGLVVHEDEIYVQCRDQLMRLHDLNHDGEADFYECFSKAFVTSPAGHDYICGLQRDREGNFYLASGNQGLVRISPDGERADVIATGFRNPDGLGLYPDGTVTVPCSEGEWTPASMICAVKPDQKPIPHFGYRGPKNGQPPKLPLVYLPRGLDNSSGGQVYVDSQKWGPLQGQLLHFSFGMGRQFLVLRDEVDGQQQGAVVPLPGEFRSGAHRGRFRPQDGHLYVSGMDGWVSFTPDDGCFQRVRYTGKNVQMPTGFHVHENGILIHFSEPLETTIAQNPRNHFAQAWNYRYSPGYGSPELSLSHPNTPGHDPLWIETAKVVPDGRALFLELPDLQPASQLHLNLKMNDGSPIDMFLTVHQLDEPFDQYPEYVFREKTRLPHPILSDLALIKNRIPNRWQKPIEGAREIRLKTATNLSYERKTITVKAGEPIKFVLVNPDVVPHNWVLIKPG